MQLAPKSPHSAHAQPPADTAGRIAARCTGYACAVLFAFGSTYSFLSWALQRIDLEYALCIENADCYQRHCVQTRTCLAEITADAEGTPAIRLHHHLFNPQ